MGFEFNSDLYWVERLLNRQNTKPAKSPQGDSRRQTYKRGEWLELLWQYRNGEQPLSDQNNRWANSTKELLRMTKTQFPGEIVDALLDRVQPLGARRVDAPEDTDGDDNVRQFFAANGSFLQDAEEYALAMSEGHILIGPPENVGEMAIATAEDPRQFMVYSDIARPHVPLVALKWYYDEPAGQQVAALYRRDDPDGSCHEHVSTWVKPSTRPLTTARLDGFQLVPELCVDLVQGAGLPVVTFRNRGGRGEFEPYLDLIDRIQNGIADRLWAAKYQLFMQRALIGNFPSEDDSGNPIDYNGIFEADPGALWRLPEGSSVWESKQLQVSEYLSVIRDDVKELAMVSRTPLNILASDSVNQSASGVDLYKDGIGFKAEDRIKRWSPDVVRVAKLGLLYSGLEVDGELEPIWASVERETMPQRAQAAASAKAAGIPREAIWGDIMHMPPATVRRWRALADMEALMHGDAS